MKHICVVGAGAIGLSCAYYLQKSGHKVTVVDNGDGSDNCSFRNAGYISPSHIIPLAAPGMMSRGLKWMLDKESPFYIKPRWSKDLFSWGMQFNRASTTGRVKEAVPFLHDLMMLSRTLIEELLAEEKIDAGLNTAGLMMYCKTEKTLREEWEIALWTKKLGQKAAILSKEEALEVNPGLEIDIKGAVHFKDDASITPHLFMEGLKKTLLNKGVEIKYGLEVTSISTNKASVVSINTSSTSIEADEFVIAAGSWTPNLLKLVGVHLLLQPGKGYSFVLPSPVVMPKVPGILAEAKIAMTPMKHGLRFAGTMELAGLNRSINDVRINAITKSVPKYFPQFGPEEFTNIEPWSGLRPCSPDGLPYIGKTRKYQNLLVASGHAMLGLTLAPATGLLISEIISTGNMSMSSPLIEVDRYT